MNQETNGAVDGNRGAGWQMPAAIAGPALDNLNAQFEALHAKIDRIVAAVEDGEVRACPKQRCGFGKAAGTRWRVGEGQPRAEGAGGAARAKTLSPLVTTLLAKEGVEGGALIERRCWRRRWRVEHRAADCGEGGDGAGGNTRVGLARFSFWLLATLTPAEWAPSFLLSGYRPAFRAAIIKILCGRRRDFGRAYFCWKKLMSAAVAF